MAKNKRMWCVLLRGINVGGRNIVKMAELREQLEQRRFQDVQTYIQSGNIVFASEKSAANIEKNVRDLIKKHWGWEVSVQTLDEKELKAIVAGNPFKKLDVTKLHVTRLSKGVTSAASKRLPAVASVKEQLVIKQNVAYLYCPDGYGKTKLTNGFFEKQLNVSATTRNWKTVNKLLAMMGG